MSYETHKKYLLPKYHQRMSDMRAALGGVCVECGTDENIQIDHIDPDTKSFTLSKGWGKPWAVIEAELKKCQLLCRGCHSDKSAKESSVRNSGGTRPAQHGKYTMRYKYRCKCDVCADFHNKRMAARRKTP